MMMSSDGSGAAVPMMNPYMPHAPAMPQGYCPMPTQMTVAQSTGHGQYAVAASTSVPPPAMAQAPSAPAAATPAAATAGAPSANPPMAGQPMMAPGAQTSVQHPQALPGYHPYMMQAPMAPGHYMMPAGGGMPGQPMTMVPHHMPQHHHQQVTMSSAQHHVQSGHGSQNSHHHQEEKESSSPSLNGGSNLAHCA